MKKRELILKNEWYINSIYSFMDNKLDEFPKISWDEKIKYLTEYYNDGSKVKITEETMKDWTIDEKIEKFPIDCDESDIRYVIDEWSKNNLPEDEFIYIEYFDDGNCGLIRIMVFELKE